MSERPASKSVSGGRDVPLPPPPASAERPRFADKQEEVTAWTEAQTKWLTAHRTGAATLVATRELPENRGSTEEWTLWFRTLLFVGQLLDDHLEQGCVDAAYKMNVDSADLWAYAVPGSDLGVVLVKTEVREWFRARNLVKKFAWTSVQPIVRAALSKVAEDTSAEVLDRIEECLRECLIDFSGESFNHELKAAEFMMEHLDDDQENAQAEILAVNPDVLRREAMGAALGLVARRASEYDEAKRNLDSAVQEARVTGASWTAIGDQVGITGQAANSRWNPEVRRRKTERQRRNREV